jgi:hypothetical protein
MQEIPLPPPAGLGSLDGDAQCMRGERGEGGRRRRARSPQMEGGGVPSPDSSGGYRLGSWRLGSRSSI